MTTCGPDVADVLSTVRLPVVDATPYSFDTSQLYTPESVLTTGLMKRFPLSILMTRSFESSPPANSSNSATRQTATSVS